MNPSSEMLHADWMGVPWIKAQVWCWTPLKGGGIENRKISGIGKTSANTLVFLSSTTCALESSWRVQSLGAIGRWKSSWFPAWPFPPGFCDLQLEGRSLRREIARCRCWHLVLVVLLPGVRMQPSSAHDGLGRTWPILPTLFCCNHEEISACGQPVMTTTHGSGPPCLTCDAVFWTSDHERNWRRLLEVWSGEPQRGGLQGDVNGSECCPR